jgi:hypothetical protein
LRFTWSRFNTFSIHVDCYCESLGCCRRLSALHTQHAVYLQSVLVRISLHILPSMRRSSKWSLGCGISN